MNELFHILFYVFAGITVLGALLILLTKNVIYAAVGLLFSLLGVAAIFVFANAEFLAVTQIVIYAGGVLILVIFGVMLSKRTTQNGKVISENRNLIAGYLVGAGILAVIVWAITEKWTGDAFIAQSAINSSIGVEAIGKSLMTTFIIPFELIAILLLMALVGAAKIAINKGEEAES